MICSIMQPTYLPWAGYFNLISNVDIFVFLDDVQFDRRSWQSRNKILVNNEESWLSVSTLKTHREALIKDILISDSDLLKKKHLRSLECAYGKSPYYHDLSKVMQKIKSFEGESLSQLNIMLIKFITENLDLSCEYVLASDLNCSGERSSHLINICEKLNITEYLSPLGSKDYLTEDSFLEKSQLILNFQKYELQEYNNYQSGIFHSHMSIVDIIANLGFEGTKNYILN